MVRFGVARSRWRFTVARWLMLGLGILPILVPLIEQLPRARSLGVGMRWLYGLQCHQRMARSLTLGGNHSFPVCARCLGIYCGLALCAWLLRPRWRQDLHKAWILIGVVLVTLDVATEWVGLRPESAALRFLTGANLAYAIGISALRALAPRRST